MPRELAIALAPDYLAAVALRAGPLRVEPVARHASPLAPPDVDGSWPALAEAFADACRALEIPEGAAASVALLPPLGQAKVVRLPRLGAAALDQLVRRDARRHFALPATAAPPLAGVAAAGAPGALLACADARVIQAVIDAAQGAGVRLDQVTAGAAALVAAALALTPAARRGRVALAAVAPGWTTLVQIDDARARLILDLSALAPGDAAPLAARSAIDGGVAVPGATLALGAGAAALAEAVAAPGAMALAPDPSRALGALSVPEMAALGAALVRPHPPLLLPEAWRDGWQRRAARRAARVAAASAAVVALVGAARLWALDREVDAVRARRAALQPVVAPVMAARQRVDLANATLGMALEVDGGSARWARVLTRLADALPDSAYLASFAGDSTGVRLSGLAVSGHAVVRALADRPPFRDVTLAGSLVRVGDAGLERFEVAARLQARGEAGVARPAGARGAAAAYETGAAP
jgi:hypothetical protein